MTHLDENSPNDTQTKKFTARQQEIDKKQSGSLDTDPIPDPSPDTILGPGPGQIWTRTPTRMHDDFCAIAEPLV